MYKRQSLDRGNLVVGINLLALFARSLLIRPCSKRASMHLSLCCWMLKRFEAGGRSLTNDPLYIPIPFPIPLPIPLPLPLGTYSVLAEYVLSMYSDSSPGLTSSNFRPFSCSPCQSWGMFLASLAQSVNNFFEGWSCVRLFIMPVSYTHLEYDKALFGTWRRRLKKRAWKKQSNKFFN